MRSLVIGIVLLFAVFTFVGAMDQKPSSAVVQAASAPAALTR